MELVGTFSDPTITRFALQNGELVRVRRDGIRRAEEQLAIAVARLRTRGATVSDSLQAVVEVSQARLRLLTEESQQAQAEANLARAIGVSGRVSAIDDSSIAIPTIDSPLPPSWAMPEREWAAQGAEPGGHLRDSDLANPCWRRLKSRKMRFLRPCWPAARSPLYYPYDD